MTPFLKRGDSKTARELARVTRPLRMGSSGALSALPFESYAGFLTTNESTDSNMFFWFFPATDVTPAEAPVVMWLQGMECFRVKF